MSDAFVDELAALGVTIAKVLPDHLLTTTYRHRLVSRYDIPAIRSLTDGVDRCLANALDYNDRLVDLELAYATLFKGSDED